MCEDVCWVGCWFWWFWGLRVEICGWVVGGWGILNFVRELPRSSLMADEREVGCKLQKNLLDIS